MQPPAATFQSQYQEPMQSNFQPSYYRQPHSQNQPPNQFAGNYNSVTIPGSS